MSLSEYIRLLKRLDQYDERIMRLQSRLYAGRVSRLTDMPKGGNGDFNATIDGVNRLNELRDKRKSVVNEINEVGLTETEKNLILCRYVYKMIWKDVAKNIKYSQRETVRIHNRILEFFK